MGASSKRRAHHVHNTSPVCRFARLLLSLFCKSVPCFHLDISLICGRELLSLASMSFYWYHLRPGADSTDDDSIGKLSSVLVDAGARPVWMPTVRYIPLPEEGLLTSQLDAALLELSSFDVVAFATKYSVLGFWERLTTIYGSPEGAQRVVSEAKVKFATVPVLSALLRDKLSLCSDRIIAADVGASDLSDVLAFTSSGAAVLCVAPVFGDGFEDPKPLTQMLNKLSFRRLDVTRAPGYIVKPGSANEFQKELQWLRNGDVDVLGLTSALEVKGLDLMLDSWDGLVPDSTSVVGNGPDTALQAARLGFDRVKVLGKKVATGEDFVLALAHHCSSRRGLQIYRDH